MGYKIEFKSVLLEGWEPWDGSGVYDVPGKNVTLNDGTQGCILMDNTCISVFKGSLDDMNDEGELFLDNVESIEDDKLLAHISKED